MAKGPVQKIGDSLLHEPSPLEFPHWRRYASGMAIG